MNDGICDCCDGTDEWAQDTPCANTCEEEGREARERAERRRAILKEGLVKKQELAEQGRRLREEKKVAMDADEVELEAALKVQEAKEEVKKEMEEKEKVS